MLFSGCSKFLDVRPKSEKLESELFTTPKGFEDAIYGVYGSMTRTSLYGKDLLWGITEVLAQNLDGGSTDNKALAKYDYTSNATLHSRLLATWTDAYETIGYANNVLVTSDEVSLTVYCRTIRLPPYPSTTAIAARCSVCVPTCTSTCCVSSPLPNRKRQASPMS